MIESTVPRASRERRPASQVSALRPPPDSPLPDLPASTPDRIRSPTRPSSPPLSLRSPPPSSSVTRLITLALPSLPLRDSLRSTFAKQDPWERARHPVEVDRDPIERRLRFHALCDRLAKEEEAEARAAASGRLVPSPSTPRVSLTPRSLERGARRKSSLGPASLNASSDNIVRTSHTGSNRSTITLEIPTSPRSSRIGRGPSTQSLRPPSTKAPTISSLPPLLPAPNRPVPRMNAAFEARTSMSAARAACAIMAKDILAAPPVDRPRAQAKAKEKQRERQRQRQIKSADHTPQAEEDTVGGSGPEI
ncbi:unnamed protein product [Parajaminaea phylloscopi]